MLKRFAALSTRDAQIFFAGQFLSLIGTWMQNTVLPYVAYRISGQPFYLGLVGFASALPTLLFTLIGGVLVERTDKRRLVTSLQGVMLLQALVLGVLTLTGNLTIWYIIGLAFVLGTANSIEITARQSMLVELVGQDALPNAIAMQSTIFNVARVLGPSLSAPFLLFFSSAGEGWAFIANAVSYLFVIIGLLMIKLPFSGVPAATKLPPSVVQQFREGQNFIRATPLIAVITIMAAVIGFFGFPPGQLLPVFSRNVLGQIGDSEALVAGRNSILATAQGVGALIAAATLVVFSNIRRKGLLLTVGSVGFVIALLLLAASKQLWLSVLAMTLTGWGSVTTLALMNMLIQLNVPNELRGRVFSTYLWALQGVAPFGSLFIGWLAQSYGAPLAVTVAGLACALAFISIQLITPVVRRFEA